ncbi:MAG: hypothetical protein HRT56_03540 [Coraliomargarita sp.]|nr:hypothetical protein [Coraliomargarita sp.]
MNSDWVVLMGHPFHKLEVLKICAFFLVVTLAFVGVVAFMLFDSATVTRQEQEIVDTHVASKQEAGPDFQQNPVEHFFEQHLIKTKYDEVNSIRALGSYTTGDVEMDFELLVKKPRYYKQVIEKNGRKLEVGFDGSKLWYRQNHPLLDDNDPELVKLNTAIAVLECSIPSLAWEYETRVEEQNPEVLLQIEILPETIWRGRKCLIVRNHRLIDTAVYHYIDRETGLELYRHATVRLGTGGERKVELIYSEPMEGLDYQIPSGFELFVDGNLFCKAQFERVLINHGLMSYLFKEPERN